MIVLGVVVVSAMSGFVYLGWVFYRVAKRDTSEFFAKLGDLTLQLAVIVIIGAIVKALVDRGADERQRQLTAIEAAKDFLRRVLAISVTVDNSRDLLVAHSSPASWRDQTQRLMSLAGEISELLEDLSASGDLFEQKDTIARGLTSVSSYLQLARDEYVRCHTHVDAGYKKGESLAETIKAHNMTWTEDLMAEGPEFSSKCVSGLRVAKVTLRREIYGG